MPNVSPSPKAPERLLSFRFRDGVESEMHLGPKASAALSSVKRKISSGEYAYEEAPCFCGESSGDTIARLDRYGLPYPMVVCARCGLLRHSPRMTRQSYIGFYDKEYRALYGDEDADFEELYKARLEQGKRVHGFIRSHIKGRLPLVLDVGCNMGTMLLPFHEEGSEVYGVDFGSEYLKKGRERTGLKNLLEGDIATFLATGKKADLIICSHSVEHFLDIETELARLKEALALGGRLFVAVPGTEHYTAVYNKGNFLDVLQNAHTWQFDNETLDFVMECCGYRRVAADAEIFSIYETMPGRRKKDDIPSGGPARTGGWLRANERRFLRRWWGKKLLAALGVKAFLKKLFPRA